MAELYGVLDWNSQRSSGQDGDALPELYGGEVDPELPALFLIQSSTLIFTGPEKNSHTLNSWNGCGKRERETN